MVDKFGMKADQHFGVDSRWSWITALFCAWVMFLTMATPRMSGIFFYGIVEAFGVTRAEASWPVSLAGTFMALGGPIAGYLCHRFSCRAVLLACSSLAGIGVSLCYLARSLQFITISFGIIHGAALCGLYVASNALLAQHFEKRRATASSFVFAAFGCNSIIITPLIELCRTTYGIHGTFLIYGAILLNLIPAVIVLRSPPWLTKSIIARKETQSEDGEPNASCVLVKPTKEDLLGDKVSENGSPYPNDYSDCEQAEVSACKEKPILSATSAFPYKESPKLNLANKSLLGFKLPTVARPFLTLTFLIHALSFAAVILSATIFSIIPADLAKDRGMNPSDAVYVLQAFSAADIAFRAVAGIAVDSHTLSHESVMLIGYLVQGLAYEWMVWLNTFPQLIAVSVFMGSAYGSRTCLQAPVLVKDFGIATLPVIMGGVLFTTGVILLLRPLVIGYFRDTYGDYNGLLHFIAAVNAFFVCVWTLKLIAKGTAKTAVTSKTPHDAHSTGSFKHKNGSIVG